ncbi:MAG TPA: hypothetical protein ENN51_05950, partial [candidate division WOR-3 bacterium]|nr:hypothetical protein [candidate division WOR-3 bacterium]
GRDTALFRRPLDLPGRDSIESISGRLYGVKPGGDLTLYYFARLHLNGTVLDTVVITPRPALPQPANFTFPVSVPAGPGPDTLTFELYGEPQATVYLDWLEVRYRARLELSSTRPFITFGFDSAGTHEFGIEGASGDVFLLDVTDPFRPRRLTGTTVTGRRRDARLAASAPVRLAAATAGNLREPVSVERREPGRLRARPQAADYYVVSPDEFYPAARLFARYRDGNIAGLPGARAEAARLSDIYDDYAFGVEEPGAIKKLLTLRRPSYTLLAGDATYDYRNCLGGEYPPMVPSYQVGFGVDPEVYDQSSRSHDVWYADFSGDGRPEMILGRITARNAVELRQALDKVRTYETQEPGLWTRRFLLLADDEYEGSPDRPDQIGFRHIGMGCEPLAVLARDLLDPVKVYLTEYPLTGINDKAGARAELLARLDEGALFWAFFGHGAGFQLTHERVLHIDGIGRVGGGSRNPIAFFGSCGVGRYDDTRFESVAEELVRMPEGGCIATIGASKATVSGPNETFAARLFGGMLDHPGEPLGPAFFAAWWWYTIYNLFGDPAARPRIPAPGLPVAVRPDTLYPGAVNAVGDSAPFADGLVGVSVRELDWYRYYRSDVGATNYLLPGYRLFSGLGAVRDGRFAAEFRVPTLDYPDTVVVNDGWYARIPGSAAVGLLAWDGGFGYTSGRVDLPLGPAREGEDSRPPTLRLFAGDIELAPAETTEVPTEFVLRGELEDESGILLAPVPDYGLSLVRGGQVQDRILLHDRFHYDLGSATRGAFSLPWRATQEREALTFFASDNYLNRLVVTCHIRSALNEPLRIDSALVWPNPVADDARFTFVLTRPAFVGVKVFTISGRLVRHLPPVACGFGYNQLHWDGRDAHGNRLANGVYLYKLDARSADTGTGTGTSVASVRDKLLVFR